MIDHSGVTRSSQLIFIFRHTGSDFLELTHRDPDSNNSLGQISAKIIKSAIADEFPETCAVTTDIRHVSMKEQLVGFL